MSEKYLFRISTKKTDAWSTKTPKPVYLVAESKAAAESWASTNLVAGLSVAQVTRLAEQVGGVVFVGL